MGKHRQHGCRKGRCTPVIEIQCVGTIPERESTRAILRAAYARWAIEDAQSKRKRRAG